jgi:hypothetical protein
MNTVTSPEEIVNISWQRQVAWHLGQIVRLVRANGNWHARAAVHDHLAPLLPDIFASSSTEVSA